MTYTKLPKTLDDQLDTLIHRGLIVPDRKKGIAWLSQVSYYRLRGYTYPFQNNANPDHPFWKPTEMEYIKTIYEFDRAFRSLVMDGIERIEIAVRTQLIYHMSRHHGAWWFEDESLFIRKDRLANDLQTLDVELGRSNEVFINHYYKMYGDPVRPPAWMSLEIVSLGTLSKYFENIRIGLPSKKEILAYFGLGTGGADFLENWLHHLNSVRNICAHHSRLWNRISKKGIKYAAGLQRPWVPRFDDNQRPYATVCLIGWLTRRITGSDEWKERLHGLLRAYPMIHTKMMGFPVDWQALDFWNPYCN